MKRKTKIVVGVLAIILILPVLFLYLPIFPLSIWDHHKGVADFTYKGNGVFEAIEGVRFYADGGDTLQFSSSNALSLREAEKEPDDPFDNNLPIWRILYKKYGVDSPELGWYDSCPESGDCQDGTVCMSSLTSEDKKLLLHLGWKKKEPSVECEGTQYEKRFEGGYYKRAMSSRDKKILLNGSSCSFDYYGEVYKGEVKVGGNGIYCKIKFPEDKEEIDCNPAPSSDCIGRFEFDLSEKGFDLDGDGIYNWNDKCSKTGDLGYGLKDNGCPYKDSDKDGVMDSNDRCPNKPGPASNQGCSISPPKPQKPVWQGIIDSIINWFKNIGLWK